MYTSLKNYSRRLQRRLSSNVSDASLNGSSTAVNGSSSPTSGNAMKPLLPETIKDTTTSMGSPNISMDTPVSSANANTVPTHAYFTLATAVIALSSIGPSLDLQQNVSSPLLKIYWRMTGTWMVLSPVAAYQMYTVGWPQLNSWRLIGTFLATSFSYAIVCTGFVSSLEYTSVGNAVIFSNTHALLLLLGRFLIGSPVSWLEGGGALIAFTGGVFCTYDEALEETTNPDAVDEVSNIWVGCWGDFIAVIAALGGVFYLVLGSSVRNKFPSVWCFMFSNFLVASLMSIVIMMVLDVKFEVSQDTHMGLFGFFNPEFDRLPLELWMICICNLFGASGYVRSMDYFDNLVIAVATLMEPVVASSLAYMMGVGMLPGFLGMLGNVLVMIGTIMVVNPQSSQKKDSCTH